MHGVNRRGRGRVGWLAMCTMRGFLAYFENGNDHGMSKRAFLASCETCLSVLMLEDKEDGNLQLSRDLSGRWERKKGFRNH